ncbi:MAG: ATP phosphoribosyltransferase [Bacillota bacterium]
MSNLTIAMPKGRLFEKSINVIKDMNLISDPSDFDILSRKLIYEDKEKNNRFLLAKPKDVPAYIEHGAADIGITGKDVIMEHDKNLYELLDLGFGSCKLVVAVPEKAGIEKVENIAEHSRIATSYPGITKRYFNKLGIQVDIIYLSGSVELGPQVGLSDLIVDITSTGTTLRKNNLIPIAEIMESSARLVVNNVSYKSKHGEIKKLLDWGRNNENFELSI